MYGAEIIERVSIYTDQEIEIVKDIVNCYLREISEALDRREKVHIQMLGTFWIKDVIDEMPVIKFTPSILLNGQINVRSDMNKYGVVLDNNKLMTAKLTGKCPKCSTDLESVSPPKCPICGTEPFEDRAKHEDGNDNG